MTSIGYSCSMNPGSSAHYFDSQINPNTSNIVATSPGNFRQTARSTSGTTTTSTYRMMLSSISPTKHRPAQNNNRTRAASVAAEQHHRAQQACAGAEQ